MARIVVLGGGAAGSNVANRLRRRFAAEIAAGVSTITVVDQDDRHIFQPGLLFVPFGVYRAHDIVRPRRSQLHPHITMRQASVASLSLGDPVDADVRRRGDERDAVELDVARHAEEGPHPRLARRAQRVLADVLPRFAVRHLSVDQAQEVTEYLDDIKDLLAAVDAISDDLNALRALGENHLYEFVRIFDHKTFALLEDDAEVAQRLLPLDTLLRGAARRGAVTRRSMDKVATKAVENALKNNTLNTPKPAEPSEPATPPVVGAPPRTTKRA